MSATNISALKVLAAPMEPNDARADTVGDYLIRLLERVWIDGEGFSGKRPFGNSSWEWDVYAALVRAGLVVGSLDSDGYLDDCDEPAANALVSEAIRALYPTKEATQ